LISFRKNKGGSRPISGILRQTELAKKKVRPTTANEKSRPFAGRTLVQKKSTN
jgi:hypothetical protein